MRETIYMPREVVDILNGREAVEWLYAHGAEVGSRWHSEGRAFDGSMVWVREDGSRTSRPGEGLPRTKGEPHGRLRNHRHA